MNRLNHAKRLHRLRGQQTLAQLTIAQRKTGMYPIVLKLPDSTVSADRKQWRVRIDNLTIAGEALPND